MFKDYQFFSNNLQDAARQILEAQEAQAKKENVEAMEPGPNEPMGQPLDEPAYDAEPADNIVKQNPLVIKDKNKFKMMGNQLNVPDNKDGEFRLYRERTPTKEDEEMAEMNKWNKERARIMQRQDAPAIEVKNRIEDQKEKRRYDKEVEFQERVRRQGKDNGIPMDELA